jgi:hypothetical protein
MNAHLIGQYFEGDMIQISLKYYTRWEHQASAKSEEGVICTHRLRRRYPGSFPRHLISPVGNIDNPLGPRIADDRGLIMEIVGLRLIMIDTCGTYDLATMLLVGDLARFGKTTKRSKGINHC